MIFVMPRRGGSCYQHAAAQCSAFPVLSSWLSRRASDSRQLIDACLGCIVLAKPRPPVSSKEDDLYDAGRRGRSIKSIFLDTRIKGLNLNNTLMGLSNEAIIAIVTLLAMCLPGCLLFVKKLWQSISPGTRNQRAPTFP